MKMAEIKQSNSEKKSSHLPIQIRQNQGPISFQFPMKTIITFCPIWFFSGYKWTHGQRSGGRSPHSWNTPLGHVKGGYNLPKIETLGGRGTKVFIR